MTMARFLRPFFRHGGSLDAPHRQVVFTIPKMLRIFFHIPDKGQVTVRYYGLYANAKLSSLS